MKRSLTILGIAALLLMPATNAFAKGEEMGPFDGTATITGPGLSAPIVVHWKGFCLSYCSDALEATPPFIQLATAAGLFGSRGPATREQPDASRLGPRYSLAFVLHSRRLGTIRSTVGLYPYGPSDLPRYIRTMPWVHAAAGQVGLEGYGFEKGVAPSGWWPAAPSLQSMLRRLGLPARAPSTSSSSVAVAGIAGGVVGFVLLLVAGAAFGRPRRRRRTL